MSLLSVAIWLLVATAILALGHFYLWKRLIRDAHLPRRWHLALSTLCIFSVFAQPAALVVARRFPRDEVSGLAFASFAWMGMLSMLFAVLVSVDVVRLTVRTVHVFRSRWHASEPGGEPAPADPTRRAALGRLVAGAVAVLGFGLGGRAVSEALSRFRVKNVEISLAKLPKALDGFRIVQITDVHIGPTIGKEFIELMVAETNALEPDLVAITGDLVDGSVEHLSEHTAPLARLKARHGTFFVTGNHEYYSGVESWVTELTRLGVQVLRNAHVSVGEGEDSFDLAGVNDFRAGRYGDGPDLKRALQGRNPARELVLLAHQPRAVLEAQGHDVGLQLSGHTHGGQFWPWNWVVHLIQPVVAGLAHFGRTAIYVSTGTGYWGPPMRLGTEAEITVVALRSGQA